MKYVKVTFENGDIIETRINGTEEEITKYYMSEKINMGKITDDFQQAVSIEFIETKINPTTHKGEIL